MSRRGMVGKEVEGGCGGEVWTSKFTHDGDRTEISRERVCRVLHHQLKHVRETRAGCNGSAIV